MSADTTSPSAPPGVQSQINAPATVTAVSLVTGKVSEAADVELRVTRTTGDNISELAPDKLDYIELSPIIFRIVVASMMIVCFMAGLDVTIVVTALPKIAQQFEADSIISWVIIAFLIAQTAVCPLVGRFSEIFGRRNVLMISVGVFTIGSLACAMSTSIIMLICFRALQGLGGGGIMSSVMVVMSDITPSRSRGMLMAPIGAVFAFSSIIGPLLGGALTDVSGLAVSGWSLCFYINLPVGVLAEVLFWVYLPGSLAQTDASRAMTIDVIGSILCIIAVTTLALALTWGGGTYPWNSGAVVSLLVIAAVFGAGFIVVEFVVAAYPIIPMRLFAVRNWWTAAWVAFWSAFGMMASVVYLPIWFQLVLGESPAQSGVSLIPMMIMMPISAMLTGVSTAKTGRYWVQPNLAAACMIISGWLLTTLSPSSTTAQRVGYLILAGLSFGPGVVVPTQQAQAAVAAEYRATTASSMSFFNFLGRLISTAIGQTVRTRASRFFARPRQGPRMTVTLAPFSHAPRRCTTTIWLRWSFRRLRKPCQRLERQSSGLQWRAAPCICSEPCAPCTYRCHKGMGSHHLQTMPKRHHPPRLPR